MSAFEEEETESHELVIIRQGGGREDEAHHGGVWKIAYADFMTAMMAFFLVMWLINATDQKTLTQVATYFNPLRLTDKTPITRGVQQEAGAQSKESATKDGLQKDNAVETKPSKESPSKPSKQKDQSGKANSKSEPGQARFTEEALFQDPYATLDKLAAEAASELSRAGSRANGEAYRDPFDPAFRRTPPPELSRGASAAEPPAVSDRPPAKGPADGKSDSEKPADKAAAAAREAKAESEKAADKIAAAAREAKLDQEAAARGAAAKLDAEIRRAVAQTVSGATPRIEVVVTSDGLLISLTDDYDFGMFAIASAEPRPAMVVIMDKLAKVLSGRPERLVVRGHTDGRSGKSGTYDNWRLSTARAHMAYYMLTRGGIDGKRFERIEGHADRDLKVPSDPEAAQNRRIEILLRKAQS